MGCCYPCRSQGQDRRAEEGSRHHRPAESGRAGHQPCGHRYLRKAYQGLHWQAVGPPLHRTAGLYHQAPAGALHLRRQLLQRTVSGHSQWRLHRHGGKDAGRHRGAAECGLSGRPRKSECSGREGGLHRPGGCLLWLQAGCSAVPQRPL